MRLIIAFTAAILVPTHALVGWYLYGQLAIFDLNDPYIWARPHKFLTICLVISGAHVIALGIPAYFFLRWSGLLSWWSVLFTGFVLGTIPVGVFAWPVRYASPRSYASANGVETMINGVPTMAGWLQYLGGVGFFGMCGLASATAFSLVRGMSPKAKHVPPQCGAENSETARPGTLRGSLLASGAPSEIGQSSGTPWRG